MIIQTAFFIADSLFMEILFKNGFTKKIHCTISCFEEIKFILNGFDVEFLAGNRSEDFLKVFDKKQVDFLKKPSRKKYIKSTNYICLDKINTWTEYCSFFNNYPDAKNKLNKRQNYYLVCTNQEKNLIDFKKTSFDNIDCLEILSKKQLQKRYDIFN